MVAQSKTVIADVSTLYLQCANYNIRISTQKKKQLALRIMTFSLNSWFVKILQILFGNAFSLIYLKVYLLRLLIIYRLSILLLLLNSK